MALSHDLITQFAKLAVGSKNSNTESTVYGTVQVDANGNKYVKLDGSDQLTPLTDDEQPSVDSTSANANDGERVSVLIKNHTATITGNISSPAARTGDVENLEDSVSEIQKFDIVVAEQLQAQEGYIKNLQTDKANVGDLTAATAKITELEASKASVDELTAAKAEITDLKTTKLDADVANVKFATIENLDATTAEIDNLKTKTAEIDTLKADNVTINETLVANEAAIKTLTTEKLDTTWANIDFANIDKAIMDEFYASSGLIENVTISEGVVVKELVGVTIKGDLIEGGTVIADKLVVLGDDGLYYKLNTDGVTTEAEQTDYNSLNGSVITAKSVTAEKVSVDDLVAFGATIGGFNITAHSLYSGVKETVDNSTEGVYMDTDAQFAIGNQNNYLKFYKDENDNYRLDISAASVVLVNSSKNIETAFSDLEQQLADTQDNLSEELETQKTDYEAFLAKFSKYIRFMEDENGNPTDTAMTIGSGDSTITLEIDNEKGLVFKKNGVQFGWWDGIDFHTGNIVVEVNERAQFGNFAYVPRSDGSLSFLKVGG